MGIVPIFAVLAILALQPRHFPPSTQEMTYILCAMSTTDVTDVTPADDLGDEQPGLVSAMEIAEVRARQQAAVLAFGRRTNARPRLDVLTQDAVALVAEVLHAEFTGASRLAGNRLILTLCAISGHFDERTRDTVVHELQLHGNDSMADFALATASAIVSDDLTEESRFHDRFLCGLGVPPRRRCRCIRTRSRRAQLRLLPSAPPVQTGGLALRRDHRHLLASSITRVKAEEALQQQGH